MRASEDGRARVIVGLRDFLAGAASLTASVSGGKGAANTLRWKEAQRSRCVGKQLDSIFASTYHGSAHNGLITLDQNAWSMTCVMFSAMAGPLSSSEIADHTLNRSIKPSPG